MKWHTHEPEKCCTHIRWLKQKEGNKSRTDGNTDNIANLASDETLPPAPPDDENPSPPEASPDVQALLASALNLVKDNDMLRDHIATALNATADL